MDVPHPSSHSSPRGRRIRQLYRIRAVLCLAAIALAVPALLAGTSANAEDAPRKVATAAPHHRAAPVRTPATTAASSTTTQAPSTTAAPVVSTTTWAPPTTPPTPAPPTTAKPVEPVRWHPPTTAAPTTVPPTTAAPAPRRSGNVESGVASYYDDPGGGCAHKTLPFGTVVHITASNGRTASCVVDDRGPFGAGRILDLDTQIFAQLAPLGSGIISVTATW